MIQIYNDFFWNLFPVIFESVRSGFAAAYDILVDDYVRCGKGNEIAKEIWPDSILDEEPLTLMNTTKTNERERCRSDDAFLETPVLEPVPKSKREELFEVLTKVQSFVMLGN